MVSFTRLYRDARSTGHTNLREQEGIQGFGGQNLKNKSSESLGVSEDNIKNDIKETGWEILEWIIVAQDRDQKRAVVNTAMKFPFK